MITGSFDRLATETARDHEVEPSGGETPLSVGS